MAEPTAQQLARQMLAATDISKFAPPPKRKKAEKAAKEQDNHHYYKIFAECVKEMLEKL